MRLSNTERIIVLLALCALCALLGYTLAHGLVTGEIDGPSRGSDLVVFGESPYLFILMAVFYAFWLLVFSWAAAMLLKHRKAA